MASQRRKRRSPTTAAPVAGHSSRYLENRRPRFQAPADSNPTRAQYDAGSARSASPLLPTASLGSSVARKNQAAHPLTRRIFLRQKEVKLSNFLPVFDGLDRRRAITSRPLVPEECKFH